MPSSVSGEIANNWLNTKNTVQLWNAYACSSEEGLIVYPNRKEVRDCFDEIKKYPLVIMLSIPKYVDDNGLKSILGKFCNLRNLYCGSCGNITGVGFAFICTLTNLKVLCLSNCLGLNDASLAKIDELSFLEELSFRNCYWLTNEGLSHLSPLRSLTILNLFGSYNLTDDGLTSITQIKFIRKLNLYGCKKLTDKTILTII